MTKTNFSSSFGDDLSPGVRFGGARYVLKRLLGRGENSEVWLAQDVRNSREVALKILPRAFLSDTNLLERLKQETQRNFLLAHPHIAATYEFVRDHSSAAIATEFMDGWSLATLRVDKLCHCYSAEEIQLWICQVCAALDYAHNEFGILHNDLKPANLLINAKDDLKITDFGIAQMIRLESSRRGLAEGVSNSIGFLSPQQVMGGAPSKADDIYSLGATVFDLLTGTPPFHKGEIIAQICSLPPPTMTQRLTELGIQTDPVPPVWEDTVARCLAKNPADRPQNAGEILELLGRKNAVEPARPKTAAPEIETAPAVEPPKAEPSKAVEQEQPHESPPVEMPQEISAPPVAAKKPALPIGAVVVLIALLALGVIGFAGLKLWKLSSASKPEAASLDSGFNPGSGAQGQIRSFAVQPDGKILVGGRFSTFDDQSFNGIVQLYNNGALDVAFAPDPNGMVHAIVLESDGHILIGGDFSNIGDAVHHRIARLNADGTVDDNFIGGCDKEVRTIVVQPDGKILVGGSFTDFDGKRNGRITRIGDRGTHDPTFDPGSGASGMVWSIALQPDGKILVGGDFTTFSGTTVGRLVRLFPDGSLDLAFDDGTGADAAVIALTVQADGKILAAGDFNSFNGVPCGHIVRLNPDGSLDKSFNSAVGPDGSVRSLAVQRDSKILIAGSFTSVDGVACNHLARLNPNGSLDRSFDTSKGADGSIWRLAMQPDGKILIGGTFNNYNGTDCGGIARLNGDTPHVH